MPRYQYECDCGENFDALRRVEDRQTARCPACGGEAFRQFVPTPFLVIPAHFRLDANWMMPEKREDMEHAQNPSQSHAPRRETFKQYFQRTYKGDM